MTTRKSNGFSAAELEMKPLGEPLSFGSALAGLRDLYGLTQAALARRVGMSKQHICDIEKGRRIVSPAKAAYIAKRLGHPADYFVKLALQDLINREGLKFKVQLAAA